MKKTFKACEQCQGKTSHRRTRDTKGLLVCPKCLANSKPQLKEPLQPSLKKSNKFGFGDPPRTDHIVVRAYAGTGKTFTEIVGVAWAFGQSVWKEVQAGIANMKGEDPTKFEIIPSEEQRVIWEAFAEGRGDVTNIVYCAFNKSIVTSFSQEWGWLVDLLKTVGVNLRFATINSLGNQAVYQAYGRLQVDSDKTEKLVATITGMDIWDLRRQRPTLLKATSQLVDLCKLTLTGWTKEGGFDPDIPDEDLDRLCSWYDVELNGEQRSVYELVSKVLARSTDPTRNGTIDFNDQNWLPVIHDLPVASADLALVDEGQDLNRCKQEFCLKIAGRRGRMCLVGDTWQAIYGFAGADVDSIPRMEKLLGITKVLTLTETRRCGKAIVREAQKIVKNFRAHPSNCEGIVRQQTSTKYAEETEDGDMVLCRVNAPLVSQALRLLKTGRKALIRGRDFGQTLQNFVKKQNADSVEDLLIKSQEWADKESTKENRKKFPSESRILALQDRVDCITAFAEEAETIQAILDKMALVFAGKVCPKCRKHYGDDQTECYNCNTSEYTTLPNGTRIPLKVKLVTPQGVLFSSVHRAKGLEADRVFIYLRDAPMPHPMGKLPWEQQQEMNLKYVAVTRAKKELIYVS